MTNMGERTQKKPGTGLITVGLFLAAIGALFVFLVLGSGGSPTVFVWALLVGGLIVAVIGFAKRILAAVERR